jgi:hypothetical protein
MVLCIYIFTPLIFILYIYIDVTEYIFTNTLHTVTIFAHRAGLTTLGPIAAN